MNVLKHSVLAVMTGSALFLAGCGGSDSDGAAKDPNASSFGSGSDRVKSPVITTQAVVTVDNASELAVAAARGIKKVVLDDLNQKKIPFAQSTATGITLNYCETGSAELIASADNSILQQVLSLNSCVVEGVNAQGDVLLTSSPDFTSMNFYFFETSLTDASGEVYVLTGTDITCNGVNTQTPSCAFGADWSEGGESYRTENGSLSGSLAAGFNVSVRVFDTKNGYVDVQTNTAVTFNCSNLNPGSGGASFTGANNTSGLVSFDSCDSLTVTLNGVATSYNWADL
ncbi:MAG: hypothetical protein H7A01_12350 [Hahellaceae bacterium]|nr:hypothetical protein [Hahellaceae bacterium]MCP5209891.1 hypothetical protein [Hahellaceae bacterium]